MPTTTCSVCGTAITSQRSTRRYCSSRCRVLAFAARQSSGSGDSVSANTNEAVNANGNAAGSHPSPEELFEQLFVRLAARDEGPRFAARLEQVRTRWRREFDELCEVARVPERPAHEAPEPPPMTVPLALKVLGLKGRFTAEEVAKQRRVLARRYHPDVNPSAATKMAEINRAADFLEDLLRGMQAA